MPASNSALEANPIASCARYRSSAIERSSIVDMVSTVLKETCGSASAMVFPDRREQILRRSGGTDDVSAHGPLRQLAAQHVERHRRFVGESPVLRRGNDTD